MKKSLIASAVLSLSARWSNFAFYSSNASSVTAVASGLFRPLVRHAFRASADNAGSSLAFFFLCFFGILQSQESDRAFACSLPTAAVFQFLPGLDKGSAAPAFSREQQCSQCESGFLLCWRRWPHPCVVLITAMPSSCKMSLTNEAAKPRGLRSPVTALVVIPGAPVRSLRPVMMKGVLLFGVSCSFFLEPSCESVQRLSVGCSRLAALEVTIAVMPSCQFRRLMALALPCDIGGASNVLTTDTPADMFEKRIWSYPHLTSKCRPC